ncbi:hypothetical protein GNIT_1607 [Glaciecola nitratireducens FR1064]|uniref:Uncharacterized protein n=2 Tax=Brumicola TaxID=3160924 RepID=G4QH93_GLANF|nr:hypothetical protein GNIT_1607 [Glaciecola nitratireducens FR1064]
MRSQVPELSALSWPVALVYVSLIWANVINPKRFQHASSSNHFFVSCKTLRELLGPTYNRLLRDLPLIQQGNYYQAKNKETRKYNLTNQAKELTQIFLKTSPEQINLISKNNKPIQLRTKHGPTSAILSRNIEGNKAKTQAFIKPSVPISTTSLHRLIEILDGPDNLLPIGLREAVTGLPVNELEQWKVERIHKAELLLLAAKDTQTVSGEIIQQYQEKSTGRLYGVNIHLQYMPKEVRQAALFGQPEYDISNCQYTILVQLAAREGLKLPTVEYYLRHKRQERTRLAKKLNLHQSTIKELLLSLIFGMALSIKRDETLVKTVGSVNKAKQVRDDLTFKSLRKELRETRKVLIKSHTQRTGICNAIGKRISKNASETKQLAHILQGQEAAIQQVVIELHGPSITLLQHDGFTSTDCNIDLKKLEAEIFNKTGIKVMYECSFPQAQKNLSLLINESHTTLTLQAY